VSVEESATASDEFVAVLAFVAFIIEGATGTDVDAGRLLWAVINDAQNAGWTTINDNTGTTWQNINTAATPGWRVVPTQE
jgi:hypothetical protein